MKKAIKLLKTMIWMLNDVTSMDVVGAQSGCVNVKKYVNFWSEPQFSSFLSRIVGAET